MFHWPQAKRRQNELSFKNQNRFNTGCRIDTKIKPEKLAKKLGIGTLTVSDILKKKEEYEILKKITKVNLLKTGSC